MKTSSIAYSLVAATLAAAQRPTNTSICDYYTTALLKDNNAANQQTLLTLLVNTAVIGNYTQPNVGIAVPGILANGTGDFQGVSLIQYFDGMLLSTNDNGMPASVNFLDGGGAAPLMMNMPANNTSSAQYTLLTHLYEYVAYLAGCTIYGNTVHPYDGDTNMYEVHKYMNIDENEFKYFITQVGLSAASFGVAAADVNAIGMALNNAFGYKCSAPASIPASAAPAPQAICIADDCPLAPNATCSDYAPAMEPATATMTSTMTATMAPVMNGTMYGNMTSTPCPTMSGTMVPYPGPIVNGTVSGSMMSAPAPVMTGTMAPPPAPIMTGPMMGNASMTASSTPASYTGAAGSVSPAIFAVGAIAAGVFAAVL
nr:hypothetical protein B0A51_17441 [Rachicladosporium sp. CCFEE 5018]